jgi:hypothetical protein
MDAPAARIHVEQVRKMPARDDRPSKRIVAIDLCRSAAIMLAMLSHCLWTVGYFDVAHYSGASLVLRLVIAASTPTFIVLFGVMLEIVYVPMQRANGGTKVARRLISRAIQCSLFYAASVLVLLLAWPHFGFLYALRCELFMGATPLSGILAFYFVMMLLAPALVGLRIRYGLWPLVTAAVGILASYGLLMSLPTPRQFGAPPALDTLALLLFGRGEPGLGGPSVMHGFTLVVLGMALGRGIALQATGVPSDNRRAWRIYFALLVTLAVVFAVLLQREQAGRIMERLANMEFRRLNNPIYFVFGGGVATLATIISVTLLHGRRAGGLSRWAFLGRTSLFTFGLGNIELYLAPKAHFSQESLGLIALAFLAVIVLQSYVFDQIANRRAGQQVIGAKSLRHWL